MLYFYQVQMNHDVPWFQQFQNEIYCCIFEVRYPFLMGSTAWEEPKRQRNKVRKGFPYTTAALCLTLYKESIYSQNVWENSSNVEELLKPNVFWFEWYYCVSDVYTSVRICLPAGMENLIFWLLWHSYLSTAKFLGGWFHESRAALLSGGFDSFGPQY